MARKEADPKFKGGIIADDMGYAVLPLPEALFIVLSAQVWQDYHDVDQGL